MISILQTSTSIRITRRIKNKGTRPRQGTVVRVTFQSTSTLIRVECVREAGGFLHQKERRNRAVETMGHDYRENNGTRAPKNANREIFHPSNSFSSLFLSIPLPWRRFHGEFLFDDREWSVLRHPVASDTILTARCDALRSYTGNWVELNRSRGHFDVYRNEGPRVMPPAVCGSFLPTCSITIE